MIMQLVDEGLLSLDSTVSEVLPGAQLGAADVGGQVTVRHLLTHTSGIDGDIFTDTGRGDDCVERYVSLLAEVPSVFAPGATYSYCNSGYVLLGRIIEVIDGQSWDESLRARLIGPLAATQTVTLPEEAILRRAAVGHHRYGAPVASGACRAASAGRADHRHARRPAHLCPPPSRRRHHRRRQAAAQRGRSHGDAVGVRRDPRVLRARFGRRTGLAAEPLGSPDHRRPRRRHHRPVGLPADRPRSGDSRLPADQRHGVGGLVPRGIQRGVRGPDGRHHAPGAASGSSRVGSGPEATRWPGWTGPLARRIPAGTPVTTSGCRGGSTCRSATGSCAMATTMTGNLAALVAPEPEELLLHPCRGLLGHPVRAALARRRALGAAELRAAQRRYALHLPRGAGDTADRVNLGRTACRGCGRLAAAGAPDH